MIDPRRGHWKPTEGDAFVLCEFSIISGPLVLDSNKDLRALMSAVVEHLCDDRLSILRVKRWGTNPDDSSDSEPIEYETIMEIEPYETHLMEEDDEEPAEVARD